MNKLYGSLICALFFLLYSCEAKRDPFDRELSAEDMQRDLLVFKEILDKAHPAKNLYLSPAKYDALVDSLRNSFGGPLSLHEYYTKLSILKDRLGCAHTYLSFSDSVYDAVRKPYLFPYPLKYLDGKLVVNATGTDLEPGAEIISVEGLKAETLLDELSVFETPEGSGKISEREMSADNFSYNYLFRFGVANELHIKYRDTAGVYRETFSQAVDADKYYDNRAQVYYYDDKSILYDFKVVKSEGYARLTLRTFNFDTQGEEQAYRNFLTNSFELLSYLPQIKGLVIDLRENGGGGLSNADEVFARLSSIPFKSFKRATTRQRTTPCEGYLCAESGYSSAENNEWLLENFPAKYGTEREMADSMIGDWSPVEPVFKGRVFVILNHNTASSGSYLAASIKYSGRGKLIGTPATGGNLGGNAFSGVTYVLPHSRIRIDFPPARIIYPFQSATDTEDRLIPDFYFPDNQKGFKENADVQMNFIIDSLLHFR